MGTRGKSVLIIEDDATLASLMQIALQDAGYEVMLSDLLAAGFNIFLNKHPDLVIMDLDLPDGSGLDLCRKIRDHKPLSATPIIILTGHTDVAEKVQGLSHGADQYLCKPMKAAELVMWVEALLRRVALDKNEGAGKITAGGLVIEEKSQLVNFKGAVIGNLTAREFQLLCVLVKERPKVLSRKYILSTLWNTVAVDHLVDTHIYNLKKKLPQELTAKIQSVPGRGFRFFEPES
jgi:two-component system alkaline phosphatase synthesis response regulator PhoP